MPDRHASAPAFGQASTTDFFNIHPRRIEIEIEMKVDIAVKPPCNCKDARDLSVWIDVGIGTAADEIGALLARLDQQFLGAWIVQQAFLRKNADLDVDRPGVVLLEPGNGMKSLEAYSRIDLDMGAHAQGALQDRLLQGARGAPIDLVLAERSFGSRNLGDRLRKRALPGLAAVEDAGLV